MNTWAPLFNKIVDSSIWDEQLHVRVMFVTLLALKDADHVVWGYDEYRLKKRANMSLEQVQDSLKVLSSPDRLRPNQPHEGRRIEKVHSEDGMQSGWLVLNGEIS